MSELNTCLKYAVGLSDSTCSCYETGRPADFDTSESGLFLTDLEPLTMLKDFEDCDTGIVWDILDKGREQAISTVILDANKELSTRFKLKRQPYTGKIGETRNRNIQTVNETYAGLAMYCADIISGSMTINAIGCIFDHTGTIDVTIADNIGNTYGTYTINTLANTYVNNTLPSPVELPLHSEDVKHLQYYIYYQYNAANKPYKNQLSCMCGAFKPIWKQARPYFNDSSMEPRNNWAKYMMMGGYQFSDLDDLTDPDLTITGSNDLNGLTVDVTLKCKVDEVFCKDSLNYESNPIAAALAFAIWYKSAQLIINHYLSSADLNRGKLINSENWKTLYNMYDLKYKEYIQYIADNVYIKTNDCFTCREIEGLRKSGIFS